MFMAWWEQLYQIIQTKYPRFYNLDSSFKSLHVKQLNININWLSVNTPSLQLKQKNRTVNYVSFLNMDSNFFYIFCILTPFLIAFSKPSLLFSIVMFSLFFTSNIRKVISFNEESTEKADDIFTVRKDLV